TINKRRGRSRNAVRISLKLEAAAAEQMSNGNGLASVAPLAPLSTPSLRLGGRLVNPRRDFRRKIIGCLPPRVSLKEESGRPTTSRSPSIEFPARPVTRELLILRRKA